jgi:hypothetical protein
MNALFASADTAALRCCCDDNWVMKAHHCARGHYLLLQSQGQHYWMAVPCNDD